jgi:hypothetical protein
MKSENRLQNIILERAMDILTVTNQGIRDSVKWESESVASVKSLVTMNTISSVNPTAAGGAAEELAEMLVKDELICGLIKDGYKPLESDRSDRNLRLILKKFAFSLPREARNGLEKAQCALYTITGRL